MKKAYSLREFVKGYNKRNERKFEDLSFAEVRALIVKYEDIDPMICEVLNSAYAKFQKTAFA